MVAPHKHVICNQDSVLKANAVGDSGGRSSEGCRGRMRHGEVGEFDRRHRPFVVALLQELLSWCIMRLGSRRYSTCRCSGSPQTHRQSDGNASYDSWSMVATRPKIFELLAPAIDAVE